MRTVVAEKNFMDLIDEVRELRDKHPTLATLNAYDAVRASAFMKANCVFDDMNTSRAVMISMAKDMAVRFEEDAVYYYYTILTPYGPSVTMKMAKVPGRCRITGQPDWLSNVVEDEDILGVTT